MALPEADPANARRQSLKLNPRARHVEPVVQMRIVRDQLFDFGVGFVNVLRVPRQSHPPEWPDAAAEQRANVCGHETRYVESMRDALIVRDLPDVVAVIEDRQPHGPE